MSADADLPAKAFDGVRFDDFYERALPVVYQKWYDEVDKPNLPPGVGILQDRHYYPLHTAFTK